MNHDMDEHFIKLERRLNILEKSVATLKSDLPSAVEEIKAAVEEFKRRLRQPHSQSSWIDNNNMGLPSHQGSLVSVHPYWRHVKYRRKVQDEVEEIVSHYKQMKTSDISDDAINVLRLPSFNTWMWEDADLLLMLEHMYEDLQLTVKFSIDQDVLQCFLCSIYLNYNQVPFHNFRHAFSVAQMMYGMICKCDLQSRLCDIDVLILLSSCICHDLDHPGFNNIYQVLEKEESNIFKHFSLEDYKHVREGMIRCILATDMARHNEILQDFRDATPVFKFDNKAHINLLFMILIKVADISNEARPLNIAEPWLECLMQEFFNQSDLEKLEGLPVSPFMDREKVTKPSSQCSFIGFVLLPLFEALGEVLPELDGLIIEPVREALDHYRRLNEIAKKLSEEKENILEEDNDISVEEKESKDESPIYVVAQGEQSNNSTQSNLKKTMTQNESFSSLCSRAASRGVIDPDIESTETEVDVSERTSKFKIATEVSRRNSYDPKGSTDRRFSEERIVSPRLLDERLRIHAESVGEHPDEIDMKKNYFGESSFFSRIRNLSGRLISEMSDENNTKVIIKKKSETNQETLFDKMKPSFVSASNQKINHQCCEKNSAVEEEPITEINHKFSPNMSKIPDHTGTKNISLKVASSESPIHSHSSSPNTFLHQKKKFSLSLDVLSKRNVKSKKDQPSTGHCHRVTSDDSLPATSTSSDMKFSPKLLQKKHESAKSILLKSISFRRRSGKEQESFSGHSSEKSNL